MIKVLIPADKNFYLYEKECKTLYEKLQNQITDETSFDSVIKNTFFYLFVHDDKLVGAIYYFCINNKLFLNGFAKRKMHEVCIECLKMSLNWFKGSIYAEAQNRASALCLIKCGFKRVDDKLFVLEQ